ncbi:MAG: hypothetical protein IID45_10260 [Planctomycetes bacterium]|nr:hypothetical protein [Planctomycetota bacterium]
MLERSTVEVFTGFRGEWPLKTARELAIELNRGAELRRGIFHVVVLLDGNYGVTAIPGITRPTRSAVHDRINAAKAANRTVYKAAFSR